MSKVYIKKLFNRANSSIFCLSKNGKSMTLKVVVITFLFLFQAQEKINVSSSVSKTTMQIGDKLTYKISIEYNSGIQIETPGEGINLGYFEVKDYIIHPPKVVGNNILEEFEYTISTYDTGAFIIPPFPVAYFETKDRSDFNIIEALEQRIYVESIFLNDSVVKVQPKSVKNVMAVPYDTYWWAYVLGVLLIIGLIYYFFVYRKKDEESIIVETKLLPHERAFLSLKQYDNFNSKDQKEINNYYTSLSMILRVYLEERFEILAVEETTFELRTSLRQIPISSPQYDELIQLIESCDLVKFAKEIPKEDDFIATYKNIYNFIMNTKTTAIPEVTSE